MLRVVFGRDRVEGARTFAVIVMAIVAVVSLGQVASQRSVLNSEATAQAAALDVARRFASVMTTYDYAHPEVQKEQLDAIAVPSVVAQVTAAWSDIRTLDASSIGDVVGSTIINFGGRSTSAIVQVDEVVSNNLLGRGRRLSGMLECELWTSPNGAWRIASFRWLIAPAPPS